MHLTHADHLQWSVTDAFSGRVVPFGTRQNSEDKFNFSMGKIQTRDSWWVEFQRGIQKLIDDHGTKLSLFYSGGSDSEIVLKCLLDMGVRPEVHTIRFTNGANSHETGYAEEFCKSLGLNQIFWDHDIIDYIRNERYMDLAMTYKCSQLAYLTVLEYIKRVDLPAVMGGEVYFQKHPRNDGAVKSPFEWYYIYREDEDGVTYRYSNATGHPLINEVFTYTPEMLYSWLTTPEVKAAANNEYPGKLTLLSVKRGIYEREMGTELFAKSKFTGYEFMGWTNAATQRKLKSLMPKMQVAKLEYNWLLQELQL